jgi:hypothetical protein
MRRRLLKEFLRGGLVTAGLSLTPAIAPDAYAQVTRDTQIDIDRQRSDTLSIDRFGNTFRQRSLLQTEQLIAKGVSLTEAPKPYELTIQTPFTYVSPVVGASRPRQDDGHATPELKFRVKEQRGPFTLSAIGDVKSDRYVTRTEVDTDQLQFPLRSSYKVSNLASLYTSYTPTLAFTPDFDRLQRTLHDVAAGVLLQQKNVNDSPLDVSFDVSGAHRFADPAASTSESLSFKLGLTYHFSDHWLASLESSLVPRWYEERVKGQYREDIKVQEILTIAWFPASLQKPGAREVLVALQFSFVRNYSTVATASITQFDVGPALKITWNW